MIDPEAIIAVSAAVGAGCMTIITLHAISVVRKISSTLAPISGVINLINRGAK